MVKLFLNAHAYSPGQTPYSFYLWSILTTIAAVARDKFFFFKFPTSPMIANLYTFLVAPSGVGKGTAINAASDYLRPYKEFLRMFIGRTTHSKWMEYVTIPHGPSPWDNGSDRSRISTRGFLVTEELGFCLSEGQRAREFLKMMTAVYSQTGRDFEEMTQAFGYHNMENPCMNWLAGTTKTWLLTSIGVENILSGFASRTIWVLEEEDMSKLCCWPVMPQNFGDLQGEIIWRFEQLMHNQGGELILGPGARFILDRWFGTWAARARDETDRGLTPLYARGHDLAIKIGMLLRVADFDPCDPYRYAVKDFEMKQATEWVENLMLVHYPRLLQLAYKSKDSDIINADDIEEIIKSSEQGTCTRSTLTKRAHNKGLNAKVVDLALRSLMERGKVELVPGLGGRGGYFYWCGKERRG